LRTLREDVYIRADACRDKGMGPPLTWQYIADHLWRFFLEHPESWTSSKGIIPEKDTFYSWVKESVEAYDRQMENG
jgi:hypothetical protein